MRNLSTGLPFAGSRASGELASSSMILKRGSRMSWAGSEYIGCSLQRSGRSQRRPSSFPQLRASLSWDGPSHSTPLLGGLHGGDEDFIRVTLTARYTWSSRKSRAVVSGEQSTESLRARIREVERELKRRAMGLAGGDAESSGTESVEALHSRLCELERELERRAN